MRHSLRRRSEYRALSIVRSCVDWFGVRCVDALVRYLWCQAFVEGLLFVEIDG